jgi:hypothetical protein
MLGWLLPEVCVQRASGCGAHLLLLHRNANKWAAPRSYYGLTAPARCSGMKDHPLVHRSAESADTEDVYMKSNRCVQRFRIKPSWSVVLMDDNSPNLARFDEQK